MTNSFLTHVVCVKMQSTFSASICDHPGVVTVKEEDYVEVPEDPTPPPMQRQNATVDPPIKLEPLPPPPMPTILEEDFTALFFGVGVLTGVLATLFVFSHRFGVE